MKRISFVILLLASFACRGENVALTKATNDLNRDLIAFKERDTEFRESAAVLPSNTFSDINAEKVQLKTALLYHYFKSLNECSEAAAKEYLMSAAVLAALADQERSESIHKSNLLFVDTRLHAIKTEAKYQELDTALRGEIERIEALRRPFKLIESAEALGLE